MSEKTRAYEKKRYLRDKPKRIAAEKAYQAKEKKAHPEIFKARAKVQAAVRSGKMKKPTTCPKCGRKTKDIEFHHVGSYKLGGGEWLCGRCHPKGEARGSVQ